jgi:hypothetical protein
VLAALLSERRLRFRLRRGNFEVELEGDFDYVRGKFEELLQSQPAIQSFSSSTAGDQSLEGFMPSEELAGILETTPDGKLHFTIPFDRISAKEAIGLILYSSNPTPMEDAKLIAEQGRYRLSGAGLQWIGQEILPTLRPTSTQNP